MDVAKILSFAPHATPALGRGRAKTRRHFVNDRAEQDSRDFFDFEGSKAPQKRTKQARAKTRGSSYTASVETGPTDRFDAKEPRRDA